MQSYHCGQIRPLRICLGFCVEKLWRDCEKALTVSSILSNGKHKSWPFHHHSPSLSTPKCPEDTMTLEKSVSRWNGKPCSFTRWVSVFFTAWIRPQRVFPLVAPALWTMEWFVDSLQVIHAGAQSSQTSLSSKNRELSNLFKKQYQPTKIAQ